MRRLKFKPFELNDRSLLCLPVKVTSEHKAATYLIPIPDDVTRRHKRDSNNVTESDVINAVNLLFFPARFSFNDLPRKQQNAILDSILNNDTNQKYLKAIE